MNKELAQAIDTKLNESTDTARAEAIDYAKALTLIGSLIFERKHGQMRLPRCQLLAAEALERIENDAATGVMGAFKSTKKGLAESEIAARADYRNLVSKATDLMTAKLIEDLQDPNQSPEAMAKREQQAIIKAPKQHKTAQEILAEHGAG